jgi:DNA-binding transcriptional ArsR family regulator
MMDNTPQYIESYRIMKSTTAVITLAALAQDTRLKIYRELVRTHDPVSENKGTPVGDLVKKLKVAPATLSFHLKELTNAKLISSKRVGRSILYRANFTTMQALVEHLLEDCCSGACGVIVAEKA